MSKLTELFILNMCFSVCYPYHNKVIKKKKNRKFPQVLALSRYMVFPSSYTWFLVFYEKEQFENFFLKY